VVNLSITLYDLLLLRSIEQQGFIWFEGSAVLIRATVNHWCSCITIRKSSRIPCCTEGKRYVTLILEIMGETRWFSGPICNL